MAIFNQCREVSIPRAPTAPTRTKMMPHVGSDATIANRRQAGVVEKVSIGNSNRMPRPVKMPHNDAWIIMRASKTGRGSRRLGIGINFSVGTLSSD